MDRARVVEAMIADYEQHGTPVQLKVKWLNIPIWVVPREADAESLTREQPGLKRGQVFTGREIGQLLLQNLSQASLFPIVMAKIQTDGVVEGAQTSLLDEPPPAEPTPVVEEPRPRRSKFSAQRPYYEALRKLWQLKLNQTPVDDPDYVDALGQIAGLQVELGAERAGTLRHRWAKAWAQETSACPGCGKIGPIHDDESLT